MKLSKKKAIIKVGKSIKLEIKNTTKKIMWSSNHPKIVKVNKNGKVIGLKAEKAAVISLLPF